jgi:anti-sigma B factor antagonist
MDDSPAPAPPLTISITTAGDMTIAELAGDLGLAAAPALRNQLDGLLAGRHNGLIVDLAAVTDCDPIGLSVLVGAGHHARQLGGALYLTAIPPQVRQVLATTGLDRHFEIVPALPTVSGPVVVIGRAVDDGG